MINTELKNLLDDKYRLFNNPDFINTDPIQFPHRFSREEDIAIAGFLSASIAWGNRTMINRNCERIMNILNNSPFDFILNLDESKIDLLPHFVHRTFNSEDFKFFLLSLKNIYLNHGGLKNVFESYYLKNHSIIEALSGFRQIFFEITPPDKTFRQVSDVTRNSACKRLNMFLMWMVRNNDAGVHFGLWNKIETKDLLLPLDVHTSTVGRELGLLTRSYNDLKAVKEITSNLAIFDPDDPVKYDFALFGIGVYS